MRPLDNIPKECILGKRVCKYCSVVCNKRTDNEINNIMEQTDLLIEQIEKMVSIIRENPPSRERSLAATKLEEAMMWLNRDKYLVSQIDETD